MDIQIGVKVIIKNSDGLALLLRRSETHRIMDAADKNWDIPGGRISNGESLAEALRREVREEINADLNGETELLIAQDIFLQEKELHVVRLTYVVSMDIAEVILSEEHSDFKWMSLDDIRQLDLEPYLKEAFALPALG
jgi:8-oxo-dGTP diphosphatase